MAGKIEVRPKLYKKMPPTYVLGDEGTYPHKLYIYGTGIEFADDSLMLEVCDVIVTSPSGEKPNYATYAQPNW